jgi:hypothetical protein
VPEFGVSGVQLSFSATTMVINYVQFVSYEKYCDMSSESRNSVARAEVHCSPNKRSRNN